MRSLDRNVFWSEKNDSGGWSFADTLQLYPNKTLNTLNASRVVADPVRVVFLTFTKYFGRYHIDHGHTFVGLILLSSLESTFDQENNYEFSTVESFQTHLWFLF